MGCSRREGDDEMSKGKEILVIMEGIINGSWGSGAVDCVIEETLKGKDIDEIMLKLMEIKNESRTKTNA